MQFLSSGLLMSRPSGSFPSQPAGGWHRPTHTLICTPRWAPLDWKQGNETQHLLLLSGQRDGALLLWFLGWDADNCHWNDLAV